MDQLRIGEVAGKAGVNLETIRYYERQGLLPKPSRLSSGYRAFSSDAVRRIRFIKRAQQLGFSLKEIQQLLALRINPRGRCGDVRLRTEAKIADMDQKIRSLQAMKQTLERLAAACAGARPVSDCPILESLDALESVS